MSIRVELARQVFIGYTLDCMWLISDKILPIDTHMRTATAVNAPDKAPLVLTLGINIPIMNIENMGAPRTPEIM